MAPSGRRSRDVAAILRLEPVDDRPIGISEDTIRGLVGGRISEGCVRAGVDHAGEFGDVPVSAGQPMEEWLELHAARAIPPDEDQDKRPGPAHPRPREDRPIARHSRKRADLPVGKGTRLDQLSRRDVVLLGRGSWHARLARGGRVRPESVSHHKSGPGDRRAHGKDSWNAFASFWLFPKLVGSGRTHLHRRIAAGRTRQVCSAARAEVQRRF